MKKEYEQEEKITSKNEEQENQSSTSKIHPNFGQTPTSKALQQHIHASTKTQPSPRTQQQLEKTMIVGLDCQSWLFSIKIPKLQHKNNNVRRTIPEQVYH